jgi:hypothetical protein
MNSRETGLLGVAAALALSALAGDAAAEEADAAQTPASPAARPRSTPTTHTKAPARPHSASVSRPPLAHTAAPGTFDAALAPLLPPVLTAVAPMPAHPLTASEVSDRDIRQQHLRDAPDVPVAGSAPRPQTTRDATPQPAGDERALEVAERVLGDGVPLQLLQTVIVPAARGVTIAEIQTESAGAVTLSVRPTKITRGSGLVAVGTF